MTRKIFYVALGALLLALCPSAEAQQPGKVPRIGYLCEPLSTWPGSHGGADFQSRFDKSTAQAEQMKEGALRVSMTRKEIEQKMDELARE